jgi:hypothetical protein
MHAMGFEPIGIQPREFGFRAGGADIFEISAAFDQKPATISSEPS